MNSNNQQIIPKTMNLLIWVILLMPVPAFATENNKTNTQAALCSEIDVSQSTKTELKAIEKVMVDWESAVQVVDLAKLGSLVTVDAEFWTHGAAPLVGRDALIAAFKPFLTQYEMQQNYDCQELVISGDWAFIRGLEVNKLKDKVTGEATISKQRAFSVLTKSDDGQWRFSRGMTNRPPED